jgi:[acyl-carrier-protein] S-malonyltransferase
MKTTLLFSGQGSQYVGMLKDIASEYPKAMDIISHADSVLNYPLSNICFEGPPEKLKETRYTQPAIYLHSCVIVDLISNKLAFEAVAGHSVGEYAALYSAGVLSFDDGLRLVSLRGELMFRAGEHEPGTMFAVIGLDDKKVEELCNKLTEDGEGQVVVPANYNSPGQLVVSGSADYLRKNFTKFKEAGAKMVTELPVSGAFHSPLMLPAKKELETAINEINFNDASVPIYSNVFAKPLIKAKDLKEALILQLTSPVLWTQTMLNMKNDGFGKYIEVGPGKVLQGLVKRTLSGVEFSGIDKAGDIELTINNL